MLWLCVICAALLIVVTVLIIKVALIHRAADEIRAELRIRLDTETNTLITISCGDRHMRRLAADLNTQLRKLRHERRRLQDGDRELKEAVTGISHDLRTPLTAICGYLDLMKQEEKTEAVSRYLTVIENRTEAMKRLTEELFRYSVVNSALDDLIFEEVCINSLLEESVSAYYAALKSGGITPVISMPECKVLRRLDRGAMSRIFGNIISNAVKYSDGDLEITLSEAGEIHFINSAPRLDELQVGKLFDRFYTVEDAKKSTGLGLSIARTLTERMNGTINASYQSGRLNIQIAFPET